LEVVRPVLTEPAFANFVILFSGWALTSGTHAVTAALVAASVSGRRHHEAFHRFFSRGTWSPDLWGRQVYGLALRLAPKDSALRFAVDDTLAPKKGPHVFGIGSHIDAVRSTRRQKIFCFGHCWVVLAILLPVPFSRRTWALPLLFRLYRNKSECAKRVHAYRKKTELAREMIDVLVTWAGERRLEVSADVAYCNDTVTRELAANVVLFGAMRPDAVLTALPPTRGPNAGRPRKRGRTLRKPQAQAADGRTPWKTCLADLYGRKRKVRYKECVAQWYRACGTRLLKIVVVEQTEGRIGMRVFFSMDTTITARQILETYAGRWAIEVCFRELKQLFGFADSSARKKAAVERTAPFVALSYSMLILWCALNPIALRFATPPCRPWYTHKRGLAFADLLRAAQRVLATEDILDLANDYDNLRNPKKTQASPRQQELKLAA
jgi:hypothetical protein